MIEFKVYSLVPRSLLSFCNLRYGKSDILFTRGRAWLWSCWSPLFHHLPF